MNIPNLEPYVIKILTHDEKQKISELIRTNDSLTHKYEYIEPKKIFNIQIILCKPEFIEQNFDTLLNGNVLLLGPMLIKNHFIRAYRFMDNNYKEINIKDIFLKKYSGILFYDNSNYGYLGVQLAYFNEVQKNIINGKLNEYFHQKFILLKEICIIDDITNYIYMLFIENIFNEE